MSANDDTSETARTADVASELSKMQLVCNVDSYQVYNGFVRSALEYCRPGYFQEFLAMMKRTLIQKKVHSIELYMTKL